MPLDGFGDFAQGSLYIPPRVIFQTQAQSQRVLKIGFHIFRGGLDFRVDAQSIQGQQRFKVMVYRENSCVGISPVYPPRRSCARGGCTNAATIPHGPRDDGTKL